MLFLQSVQNMNLGELNSTQQQTVVDGQNHATEIDCTKDAKVIIVEETNEP